MSYKKNLFAGGLALLSFFLPGFASHAQDFGLGGSATPNPVLVSNTITYTIFVTNRSGLALTEVFVTNSFSASGSLLSTSNNMDGTVTIAGNSVVFRVLGTGGFFFNSAVAELTVKLAPFAAGNITNEITVTAFGQTNAITNLVTQVILPTADLAVGLTNAASGVFTNDTTIIGLFVTNNGPSTATGVVASNQVPESFTLLSVSPATTSYNHSGSNLTWNIGSLTSGVVTQLFLTVRPTIGGPFALIATASANVNDTNSANNAVTNVMNISSYLPADLGVIVLSQQISRQTGLLNMWVQVTNRAATNVPALRVLTPNLPASTWLYNATGTNADGSYVSYNSVLAANSSLNLLLEFYRIPRAQLTNYTPVALALLSSTVPPPTLANTNIALGFSPNGFLIEFPATIGKTYTILYSDNVYFSNAVAAVPSIVAPATRVQWIDSGPPKTISHPTNSGGSRFYRVQEAQ